VTCPCGDAGESAALRQALGELTREVAGLRSAMGGPFDGTALERARR